MRKNIIDISGVHFGRLKVIRYIPNMRKWECLCNCGNIIFALSSNIRAGKTKSCGCLNNYIRHYLNPSKTHGMSNLKEYSVYRSMIQRCEDINDKRFHLYGGRGISVSPVWRHDFKKFINDMGLCPSGYSIDRIDNNGNYEPGNCRWATYKQQANNKSNNIIIEHNGLSLTPSQWSELLHISRQTIVTRLKKGLPTEIVLSKTHRIFNTSITYSNGAILE